MLDHLLCPRIAFPCEYKDGEPLVRASILRKECCDGSCQQCAAFEESDSCVFNCPVIFNDDAIYHWREFTVHRLDNGKDIRELREFTGTLQDFHLKFRESFEKYRLHYFQYRWLNLTRKVDMLRLGPRELYIQTDYAAQPTMDSQDKGNSVGHGVCVLSCWVVLHSPRRTYYLDKNGDNVYYTYYTCDHIRVVTPSTGKQKDQDWYLHCNVLGYLIRHYKRQIDNLQRVVLWTDGAPNQYKCRQNFYWISNVEREFGVSMIHRFGATAQFKGIHDKIGQVAKWIVRYGVVGELCM